MSLTVNRAPCYSASYLSCSRFQHVPTPESVVPTSSGRNLLFVVGFNSSSASGIGSSAAQSKPGVWRKAKNRKWLYKKASQNVCLSFSPTWSRVAVCCLHPLNTGMYPVEPRIWWKLMQIDTSVLSVQPKQGKLVVEVGTQCFHMFWFYI